jgi:histidinol-phosphate phosphatase family protein
MQRLLSARAQQPGWFEAYNLGSQQGYSVREVITACEKVSGQKIDVHEQARRVGDPDVLVAESTRAAEVLGFHPKQTLEGMLSSAWEWEKVKGTILRKAIFLDRDGTLNEDPGYLSDPDGLKLLPQVGEALQLLKGAGFVFIVVSNQSGVGRGLIDRDVIPKIHERLDALLKPWGVRIAQYQLCFHLPAEACACRKPKPKLILDAIQSLRINPAASYFIGVVAGLRGSLLVRTGHGMETEKLSCVSQASFIGDALLQVAQWVVSQKNEFP